MSGRFPLRWQPRAQPLAPRGVVAWGPAARALARRLLSRSDLSGLDGVAGDNVIAVRGEGLPWAPGVTYVGPHPEARGLWLPTTLAPTIHPALLERALLQQAALGAAPLAVTPEGWLPLGGALPLARDTVSAWADRRD